MKKLLLPMALMALVALPASAQAEQCRNAKGQFAKCGTPGAMPSKAKAGPAMKPAAPAMKPAAPAMKPAAPTMKPAMAPAAAKPAAPAMAPAKKAPCKDAKGKFIKCAA
ncbi:MULTISPECIES: hypothetical protein [unclassified Novosphingobium]|uniref:hypothetical protein n=1 Tax=unclassified Novosphingobium TaxID=2644732 RepID=UPI00086B3537|nr:MULTISPECIES: hypothetical protein [unclassified Novosphingobium]MBN9144150.1 hypothetical protein [Novosphingobium sp.]MDR6708517.1 putative lipid-binding transport protein (Tim44 family) [Novosphingobium sp. 1748]ODU78316.1 MAG: hypothetical protein ABT10_22895 [Novosphingobium sp. SCN 63-17]OJX95028.1 MAG: hypothetical protein BGP00_09080 [Novosphingobium sp. 63-713]